MENAEEILQRLDEFSKHRPKTIPKELEDYLCYVARTGDPVYQWSIIKYLFREKLLSVITDFYETSPGIDIPQCPNVDPFNYDVMKNSLVERIDGFASAPFTVQRICELLTTPRKNYNRIDKFMRAVEKNILVVSTREPGPQRHSESESGEHIDSIVNGSENSEYNVDVEMEDISNWKENYQNQERTPQPSSSDMVMNIDIAPSEEKTENVVTEQIEDSYDQSASVTPNVEISLNSQNNQSEIVSAAISEPSVSQPDVNANTEIEPSENVDKTDTDVIKQNDDCNNQSVVEPTPVSVETAYVPPNEQSDVITKEIQDTGASQPAAESTKETEPPEVQLAATEFLVESAEPKSPTEPETDPLALEETATGENPSDKQTVTTVPEENTIILSSILFDQKEQKELPDNSETHIESNSIENVPPETAEDSTTSQT